MSGVFKNKEHLARMAGLFVVGILTFLVLRWWMVPPSFGRYGHYRAAALAELDSRPLHYAGRAACVDCHADVVAARKGSLHERIGCEACHGPLLAHVEAGGDKKPALPDSRVLCPRCHAATPWRPKRFPQVVVAEHAPEGPCITCHNAHAPKIS
jgi:Cytochrome c554 and c-prime